jgi:hypothetical protein
VNNRVRGPTPSDGSLPPAMHAAAVVCPAMKVRPSLPLAEPTVIASPSMIAEAAFEVAYTGRRLGRRPGRRRLMSRHRLRDIGQPRLPLEHASHARCLEHIAIGANLRAQSTLLGTASRLRGDEEPAAATGHDASSLANRSSRTSARNAGAFLRFSVSKCLALWR